MTDQELVALLEKWKDQIVKVTTDYKDAISTLEKSRLSFEDSKNRFYSRHKFWLNPIIWIITVVIILSYLNYTANKSNWCSTSFLGLDITRSCGR